MNFAWAKSFAKEHNNKEAIAQRGWFPPSRKLLSHPEVLRMLPRAQAEEATESNLSASSSTVMDCCVSVNTTHASSSRILDTLLMHASRQQGVKRRHEALADGTARVNNLKAAKKITAGLLVSNNIHSCNDPLLLNALKEKKKAEEKERLEKEQKESDRLEMLYQKVKQIRASKPNMEDWTATECKVFLQYKKMKDDGRMPSSIADLKERCRLVASRPSPPRSRVRQRVVAAEPRNDNEASAAFL